MRSMSTKEGSRRKPSLIILEGIATTGKTTLQKLLKKKLSKRGRVKIFSEETTLLSLVENKLPKVALAHLQNLFLKLKKSGANFCITDRFHFTHIFRTSSTRKYFIGLEKELLKNFNVLIVLLTLNESIIRSNILDSLRIRKTWAKGKQGTISEKTQYYTNQQRKLLKIADKSELPVLRINTTNKDWDAYISKILKQI